MKSLTKKNTLALTMIFLVLLLITMDELGFCRSIFTKTKDCLISVNDDFEVLWLGLLLSVIPIIFTLPFNPIVFEVWKKFAIWAGPVTAFLSAWVLNLSAGGGLGVGGAGGTFFSIAILSFGFYYLASLVVIGTTWYKVHTKKVIVENKLVWLGWKVLLITGLLLWVYLYFLA